MPSLPPKKICVVMASDPSGISRRFSPFSTASPPVWPCHPRFSTWLGRPGIYLEDLFVTGEARGKGIGRRLITRLAAIAVERGWERIDFQVLDWNPARGFYRQLGFEHLGEWLRYGGDAAALRRLAAEDLPDRD